MKKIKIIILIISCVLLINTLAVNATAPKPTPYVFETTIAGIVPIDDESVVVNQATIDLDFKNPTDIPVDMKVEKRANLKMIYDLNHNGMASSVKFSLPILNKLNYLNNDIKILVDGEKIKPTLNISPKLHYQSYNNYTEMMKSNFLEEYREDMLADYEFLHDVEGYQYKVKTPKTKGENYYVNTELLFLDVPNDTVFVLPNKKLYGNDVITYFNNRKSEEELIFFSSTDLSIQPKCTEVFKNSGLNNSDEVWLGDPTITKEEMKLSEYLNNYFFEEHMFLEALKNLCYYTIDQQWNDSEPYHFIDNYVLHNINVEYYEMSLDFDIEFNNRQAQVEIQLPIPVHYFKGEMKIDFVANPANKITDFHNLIINIYTDEELKHSSIPISEEGSHHRWVMNEDMTLQLVYLNPKYKESNPYGIIGIIIALISIFNYLKTFIYIFIIIILVVLAIFFIWIVFSKLNNKRKIKY